MKIVMIQNFFCKKTGYSDYFLCKYFAKAGHEVHLIAGNLQLPYDNYEEVYKSCLGDNRTQCGTEKFENFTLHIIPVQKSKHRFILQGTGKKLSEINPDIVLINETVNPGVFKVILHKILTRSKYEIFTEDHVHLSVFPPAHEKESIIRKLKFIAFRSTFVKIVNHFINKCYVIAPDTEEIMTKYFGIKKNKISFLPLAADTDWFRPPETQEEQNERKKLRASLNVAEDEILCIYTGRFSFDKNPQCLAEAIDILQKKGAPYKALFVGSGTPEEVAAIKKHEGCIVHDFVLARDLPPFYKAADIGVWPKQESTSQLDAMASSLPIVVSNLVKTKERIQGNALQYKENNAQSLADTLLILENFETRKTMGMTGRSKIEKLYNWESVVDNRLRHFKDSLR
ncbi:MAG: glycosyltransferase family 4 protein [Lentisphaerae bacterium]|nr:glycosyltransferase family 4 protein [Lentisphaerota bacterium]MCP4100700.1 glycosyltransferase family 4 protein [Lentisphaerota bacterium]